MAADEWERPVRTDPLGERLIGLCSLVVSASIVSNGAVVLGPLLGGKPEAYACAVMFAVVGTTALCMACSTHRQKRTLTMWMCIVAWTFIGAIYWINRMPTPTAYMAIAILYACGDRIWKLRRR